MKKPSYSAFFATELASVLDELKIDTLVLAGCLTEIGIMATATDAKKLGLRSKYRRTRRRDPAWKSRWSRWQRCA